MTMKGLLTLALLAASASASHAVLLAHFALNETSGNAVDSSANAYQTTDAYLGTGMIYGQASVSAGTYGAITISHAQAARFGTSIDFGTTGDNIGNNIGNFDLVGAGKTAVENLLNSGTSGRKVDGAMTLMAWVNLDTVNGLQNFFSSSSAGGWRFAANGSNLRFTTLDSQDFDITAGLVAGQWYRVASSVQNDTVSFYLNGNQLGTRSLTIPYVNEHGNQIKLGGFKNGTQNMYGRMDDVKFYTSALDASAIAAAALPMAPVPEPGTALMSAAGLALLGALVKRQPGAKTSPSTAR